MPELAAGTKSDKKNEMRENFIFGKFKCV